MFIHQKWSSLKLFDVILGSFEVEDENEISHFLVSSVSSILSLSSLENTLILVTHENHTKKFIEFNLKFEQTRKGDKLPLEEYLKPIPFEKRIIPYYGRKFTFTPSEKENSSVMDRDGNGDQGIFLRALLDGTLIPSGEIVVILMPIIDHIPIDNESNEKLKKILHNFNAPIRYAFAYGSGVFSQKGYDEKPMVDFIFAVSYPQHWHSLNLKQNKNHYSFIRSLGSRAISSLQENVGASVYFNPYVQMDDMIKILRDDARVRLAQQVNLSNSLRTALLLLPKDFTEEQLYLTIAAISFKGDFRKFVGENPNKIKNVVSTQINNFNLLYSSLINALPNVTFIDDNNLQQDDSPKARAQMIQKLPRILKNKIQEEYKMAMIRKGISFPSDEKEIIKNIASSEDYSKYIETGLGEIIFWPAITQSLKGILTAGMFKSGKYISSKLGKWMFGK
ncbi:9803_t:CDS:10 [Diversispora eburnea]|uniref:Phosphatidate cytidylyltransferase, mitochondrial n=1 Tax=Diversispora eburnea TaxID=1213867 RepID=A0A9N8YTW6_9GLOM|nr:9803_t:CDS:10 [Diversispora eburnea]